MRYVLITGVKGMAGSHLSDFLNSIRGFDIYGIDLPEKSGRNVRHQSWLSYNDVDIRDAAEVRDFFEEVRPQWVFHLAAEAFVPTSWNDPQRVVDTNVKGTVNVLEASRLLDQPPVVQIACTSEQYGLVYPEEVPIDHRKQPFRPMSTYGVTKVASEHLGLQYAKSYDLRVALTRTFNHTGPRQDEQYVTSSFVRNAVLVRNGEKNHITHGNLDAMRDFTDVRDIVRGYVLAMRWVERTGQSKIFQMGGGDFLTIREVLDIVLRKTDLPTSSARQVQSKMRPSDVPILHCDSREFREMTGWSPLYDYKRTVDDVITYWQSRYEEGDM